MPGSARFVSLLPLVLLLAGCGDRPRGEASPDVTVHVENGVTIVEHPGLHIADSTAWRIDPEPFLSIGSLEGDESELFGRVVGLASLPTGEIVVADGQTMQLRLFDEAGGFLRTVGRQGEGPGEFFEMSGLRVVAGDSVVVLNRHGGRVHLLDPDLEFVRRSRPRLVEPGAEPVEFSASIAGVFGDGRLLMIDYMRGCGVREAGLCADSARFFRTDAEGRVVAGFGQRAYGRTVFDEPEGGPFFAYRWPHPQPIWATGVDGRFYHVESPAREVLVFSPAGALEQRIVLRGRAPAWSRRELFPRRTTRPAGVGIDSAGFEAMDERMRAGALPDTFPTFADIAVDADGWLWLQEYLPPAPDPERPPRWYIFDPDGHLRHSVRAPPGMTDLFRPASYRPRPLIGRSRILAVTTDELGVERVVGYRIRGRE